MKKTYPLCKKIDPKKIMQKLTSDSDSQPPITFGQSCSHKNDWFFIGLHHADFWLAWSDKL
jgi:hypothetical protein